MKHYQTKKNDDKDERIYYNFCYEGVRDEIGEDNTATSIYTFLILTKEIKGVNGNKAMLHIEFNNGNQNHTMNEG